MSGVFEGVLIVRAFSQVFYKRGPLLPLLVVYSIGRHIFSDSTKIISIFKDRSCVSTFSPKGLARVRVLAPTAMPNVSAPPPLSNMLRSSELAFFHEKPFYREY